MEALERESKQKFASQIAYDDKNDGNKEVMCQNDFSVFSYRSRRGFLVRKLNSNLFGDNSIIRNGQACFSLRGSFFFQK